MKVLSLVLTVGVLCSALAMAQEERRERIRFEPGTTSATVEDSIQGYQSVLYSLGAGSGQSMTVVLETSHTATYFNVFEPGKKPGEDGAMFIGSTEGNRFEGILEHDGDYLVQVYMMRSAARRNETAKYSLEVSIEG